MSLGRASWERGTVIFVVFRREILGMMGRGDIRGNGIEIDVMGRVVMRLDVIWCGVSWSCVTGMAVMVRDIIDRVVMWRGVKMTGVMWVGVVGRGTIGKLA